jgi:hypothetical protein
MTEENKDPAAVPPKPKLTWRERWEDQLTRRERPCIFIAYIGSICVLVAIILTALHFTGYVNMLAGPVPPTDVEQSQPQAQAPERTIATLPNKERWVTRVAPQSVEWVVKASKGTKWEASGTPECFQIDLDAWRKVTLNDVPALVDCTKAHVTADRICDDGNRGWDVRTCVVAYRSDWRPR